MSLSRKGPRTVGIIGGMGPEATVDLFHKILKATPATRDQDHLRILVDCNPQIPDRTGAIAGSGPDPVPAIRATARNLERAGAHLLVMPCNTAHHFFPAIQEAVGIPLLHIMEETARFIQSRFSGCRRVGLLATDGTLQTRLYHRTLEARKMVPISPDRAHQSRVMAAIYPPTGVKAGHYQQPRRWIQEVVRHLAARGAEVVILGCTELPLAVGEGPLPVPAVDPTGILAAAAVREAMGADPAAGVLVEP